MLSQSQFAHETGLKLVSFSAVLPLKICCLTKGGIRVSCCTNSPCSTVLPSNHLCCCTKKTSGLHNCKINHLLPLFHCGNTDTHQCNISACSLTACISLCSNLNSILGPHCLDSCQWITHRRVCWQCTTTVWDTWTVVQ